MIRALRTVLGPSLDRPLRRMIAGIVAAAALQGLGFVLLMPCLHALLRGDTASLWRWIGVELVVLVAYAVAHRRSQLDGYVVATGMARGLFSRLGDQLVRLPLGWFSAESTGRVARTTSRGVVEVIGVPAHLLRPVISAYVTPVVVIAALAAYEWRLALGAVVTAPLVAVTYRWSGDLLQRSEKLAAETAADAGGRVVEFARAQAVLRAFGRAEQGNELLDRALRDQRDARRAQLMTTMPGFVAYVAAVQATFTVALILAVVLVTGGHAEPVDALVLLVLTARYIEPMVAAGDLAGALRIARNSIERMDGILGAEPLPEPAVSGPSTAQERGAVVFDRVGFAYGDRTVLHDVSFEARPGTMTAIVGPSGSGKTTIARLVARFWDVGAGSVKVGGVDVRDLRNEDLWHQLTFVLQDPFLFEGTIAENLLVAKPRATPAELDRVAGLARVDEIVDRLDKGWSTPVGEGGHLLSGGERERVALARALLKKAPVLVLDEATAALDPLTEVAVGEAIDALRGTTTVLVIAHRLATVASADQILVLDDGRIAERGRHDQLLAAGGRYHAFWQERSRVSGWRVREPVGAAGEDTAQPTRRPSSRPTTGDDHAG